MYSLLNKSSAMKAKAKYDEPRAKTTKYLDQAFALIRKKELIITYSFKVDVILKKRKTAVDNF